MSNNLVDRVRRRFDRVTIHPTSGSSQERDWSAWALRPAGQDDVELVASWFTDDRIARFVGIPSGELPAQEVRKWIRYPRCAFVLVNPHITVDGRTQPFAFVSVEPLVVRSTTPTWEVGRLVVAPSFRSRGIGETLVRRMYTAVRESLDPGVCIVSRAVPDNHISQRMCMRAGLHETTPPPGLPTANLVWFTDQ